MRQALCLYKDLNHGYIYPYKTPFFLLLSPILSSYPFLPFRGMLSRRFVHCAAYHAAPFLLPFRGMLSCRFVHCAAYYAAPFLLPFRGILSRRFIHSAAYYAAFLLPLGRMSSDDSFPKNPIFLTFPSSKICTYQIFVVSLYPIRKSPSCPSFS